MTPIKYLLQLICISILIHPGLQGGDDRADEKRITPSLNKQRAGNAFYQSIHFQKMSASRFLPLFNITGVGNWSSPRTVVTLDGLPYNGYPFGMQSIDLVPVDLITVDTLTAKTGAGIARTGQAAGGAIDIIRSPIPGEFTVDIRLFTGSETGDPLIHIFTRPDQAHINKNKVGPSFALSIANTKDNWSYRISGGGFFYFSTGSVNDYTIGQYNPGLMPRQNRQVKIIGEAVYTIDERRSIDFYTGGINLFGWEMSPFTSLFNHYTNVSSTGRIRYSDTAAGYSLGLVRDESFVWTKEMAGALPGSIRLTEWTFYPEYEISIDENSTISLFSSIGILNVRDLSGAGPREQSLLLRDVSSVNRGGGVGFEYANGRFFTSAGVRLDSKYEDSPELSGELSFGYRPYRTGIFYSSISSTAYSPDYLERYGTFLTTVGSVDPNDINEFTMSGNPALEPERIHEIKLALTETGKEYRIHTEVFGRWTDNRIIQHVERSFRPAETGEILRTATYSNDGSAFVPGITVQFAVQPFDFIDITSEHQYIDNADIRSLPRYKSINTFGFGLPLGVMLDVLVMYTGETEWDEFTLAPEDDALWGEGSDGVIRSATVFDISVSRRFGRFYFMKGLEVSIQAQNLFNEPFRRIPVGNFIDRAVFLYVSFGL